MKILVIIPICLIVLGCSVSNSPYNNANNKGKKVGKWVEVDSSHYTISNYKNGKLHGKKINMFEGGIYGEAQYKNDSLIKSFRSIPTLKE